MKALIALIVFALLGCGTASVIEDCPERLQVCEEDLALKRPEWIECQEALNECKDALFQYEQRGGEERDTYGR